MNNELRIQNLKYKDVLKDINVIFKQGTITAIMGSSGSGKTMFFKSLFNLIKADGDIIFNGEFINKDESNKSLNKLGIYLGVNVLTNNDVFDNIAEPLKNLNYDEDKIKKKVYEITKKLGIEKFLYKNINLLSHSEKKIVAFTQSIIHEPKILLIDNLFDSIDQYYKDKIILYLKSIKKNKKCIIIFTTNNSEDLLFTDNLIVFKSGEISLNECTNKILENENLLTKHNIKLPFMYNLSYKLQAYNLIDTLICDIDEMVEEIWQ